MLNWFVEFIEALKFQRQISKDMRAGRRVDLNAATTEALEKFPCQDVAREARARSELARRRLLNVRQHDA